jgi:hypothetical protein
MNPFQFKSPDDMPHGEESDVHVFGNGVVCDTDRKGHAIPDNADGREIVVDASEGFIPLWERNTTLRWRFQERSLRMMRNPQAAQVAIRSLLGDSLLAWSDAVPIKFSQRRDLWDFEIVIRRNDECDTNGCVLASAFFPSSGRQELTIYPRMFTQSPQEQVETLAHEIGHIFGLRHFFANITETRWASEIFGTHKPFSIMNYGSQSHLTNDDRADLKRLYQMAWSGELTQINRTPIKLVKSFHASMFP